MLTPFRSASRPVIAAVAVLALTLSGCQNQQPKYETHREAARRERLLSGAFDYYVLSLSWAPAFCAHDSSDKSPRECDPKRGVGFVVHGLWPQRDRGRPLEYCENVPPLSHAIVDDMLSLMPDRSLVQHEWRAHGSCSGLSPREYFATVRQAASKVHIPPELSPRSGRRGIDPEEIAREFESRSGFVNVPAVRVACRDGELTEVRVCFSRSLQPIPCGPGVHACRESRILVRASR